MTEWKTESLDIMKVLSDPRRMQILTLAEKPITVKELAEHMDEKPSRLYYHVNKLQEAGLLQVVDQKQTGNLVEKYYQSDSKTLFKGNLKLQAGNPLASVAGLHRSMVPGLKLYEKSLEKIQQDIAEGKNDIERHPYHISLNRSTIRMSAKEWQDANIEILDALRKAEGDQVPFPKELRVKMTPEEEEEIGSYHYFIISYRIEDAQKLGLIEDKED